MKYLGYLLGSFLLWFTMQAALFAQLDVKVTVSDGVSDIAVKSKMEQQASNVLSAFNRSIVEGKKLKDKLKDVTLSKEMEADLTRMWKSSAMLCPVSEVRSRAIETPDRGYQLRNIPISMLATDDDEQELVLEFTSQGDLSNVKVALDKQNYNQVICSNITVEDFTRRQIILDFVENFRTAYNRMDWDYLNNVYSEDALIITGHTVVKKTNNDGKNLMNTLPAQKLVLQVQSKQEYMEKLKRVFKKNSYLNLKFEDLTVRRHPKYAQIYGVTLKQYWNSSTYNDVGYLFLMINFSNENQPTIEVRTWQPEQFENGVPVRQEIFSLEDFNI